MVGNGGERWDPDEMRFWSKSGNLGTKQAWGLEAGLRSVIRSVLPCEEKEKRWPNVRSNLILTSTPTIDNDPVHRIRKICRVENTAILTTFAAHKSRCHDMT